MNESKPPAESVAQRVKKNLHPHLEKRKSVSRTAIRAAATNAVKGTRVVGGGATLLARESAKGAVQAAGEIGGEAEEFVKDSIIGVLEGTGQIVRVTAPAIKGVVIGAMRGSRRASKDLSDSGREAVEGAIVGAASVGVDAADATVAAVQGAVEAVAEAGGDLEDATRAAVGGVVSGAVATGGDVAAAAKNSVQTLISGAAKGDRPVEEIVDLAETAVDAAIAEAEATDLETHEVATAVASGAVEAAYHIDHQHGDRVKQSVLRQVLQKGLEVGPELEQRFSRLGTAPPEELPRSAIAWRWLAMIRAGSIVLRRGGLDLSASLAYFTIMSLLPLAALVLSAAALFGDRQVISEQLTDLLVYYFPASADLVGEAIEGLINESLIVGAFAFIGLILAANGLFLAANRAIHRIFELEPRGAIRLTLAEMVLATIIASLFLVSVGLTALHQVALSFGEGFTQGNGALSTLSAIILGIVGTALPAAFTAAIFAVVYYRLPNLNLRWRDAVFGAIIGIVLFEAAKHLFFWFTNLTSQRNAVYGPIASVVVMMTWAYLAGMIFLYGAALTRAAGEMRPKAQTERKFNKR